MIASLTACSEGIFVSVPGVATVVTRVPVTFAFKAVCVALETGLFASEVLSTLPRSTEDACKAIVSDHPLLLYNTFCPIITHLRYAIIVSLSSKKRVVSEVAKPKN